MQMVSRQSFQILSETIADVVFQILTGNWENLVTFFFFGSPQQQSQRKNVLTRISLYYLGPCSKSL